MKFEEKLMKLRKEKAWSQEELAEKLILNKSPEEFLARARQKEIVSR